MEQQEAQQTLEEQQHRQEQQQQTTLETEQVQKTQADQLKSNPKEKQAEKERLINEQQSQEWQVLEDEDPEPRADESRKMKTKRLSSPGNIWKLPAPRTPLTFNVS